ISSLKRWVTGLCFADSILSLDRGHLGVFGGEIIFEFEFQLFFPTTPDLYHCAEVVGNTRSSTAVPLRLLYPSFLPQHSNVYFIIFKHISYFISYIYGAARTLAHIYS
uniref:hypothetical protein n=1 Tax=Yoonia sp. TaxID=2212373 RepID=UPI004048143A